jgi:hypothetical protein
MVHVIFSSELQRFTREAEVQVIAEDYRHMVAELTRLYPDLSADKLMGMAVAIDGEIVHNPLLEKLPKDTEVHFLYRISGG